MYTSKYLLIYIYMHRGRAWVAQLWAKSVGAVLLRALPFFSVQQGCLRVGVSRCGPAAVVGRGC